MNADVKLIRLCRKTSNSYTMEGTADKKFLATDYFDILKYENISMESDFQQIMKNSADEFPASNDVALQSYPIYCSEKTLQNESKIKYFGDPFCGSISKMPFLSLIQIHITPEIFVHLDMESGTRNIIGVFENDIHELLEHFVTANPDCRMVCRVYQLLSTGDFAVAIRSVDADTSFRISTLLRKRAVSIKGSEFQRLVLYKTYTLLTIDSQIVKLVNTSESTNNFVIRCCYSNKYWAECDEAQQFMNQHFSNGIKEISRLNGRYDFSVQLSQQEFGELFPFIWELKNGKLESEASHIEEFDESKLEGEIGKADFFKYLIKKEYLSYINERYLLNTNSLDAQQNDDQPYTLADLGMVKTKIMLYERNCQKLESVRGKYKNVSVRFNAMDCYRKNMMYHFLLLGKLINLSQVVNSISDTRIHTSTLLEQASVVLQSLDYYIDIYEETKDPVIINLIEEYLRESVCALDSFARYIRNNNLQSLQTPNYNIESTTSMEKILIGYSEFARLFLEYYLNSEISKRVGLYAGERKQYLPIVISKLSREDLSVEVVFPEGKSISWRKEQEIQGKKEYQNHTYLVIITCPTIRELGNLPNMLTSLYHEVAHQFRYKSRKERNKIMLRYALSAAFEIAAKEIVSKFTLAEGCRNIRDRLVKLFRDNFTKAYIQMFYCKNGEESCTYTMEELLDFFSHEYEEAPLNTFRDKIYGDFSIFMDNWKKDWEAKSYAKNYIRSLSGYLDLNNEEVKKDISRFYDKTEELKEILFGEKLSEEDVRKKENLCKELNQLAMKLLFKVALGLGLQNGDPGTLSSDEAVGDGKHKIEKAKEILLNLKQINYSIYESFITFIYGLKEFAAGQHIITGKNDKEEFLECTYHLMHNDWEKQFDEVKQNRASGSVVTAWEAVGRYYGIDFETKENRKIYCKSIDENMTGDIAGASYYINSRINFYREEASDLFMTAFLPLTPFGYLNLMASNIPSDNGISVEHTRRIIRVLTARWINEQGAIKLQEAIYKFYEECGNIFDTIRKLGTVVFKKYKYGHVWEAEYSKHSKIPDGSPVSDINVLQKELEKNAEILEKTCQSVLEDRFLGNQMDENEHLKLLGEIRHFCAVCKVFRAVVVYGRKEIKMLYETEYLLNDFREGVEVLRELPPLSKNDNGVLNRLEELNQEIAGLLNQPQDYYNNAAKYTALNEKSITFLLDAYYHNKLWEARCKNCGGNAE